MSIADLLAASRRIFVLTGAGVSTDSGIPDYRDEAGNWKRRSPVNYRDFTGSEAVRKRYWSRSMIGWERMRDAVPNGAHAALARLEAGGRTRLLVTQNVDGLHQAAGSRNVLDLHGRIDAAICLECGSRSTRAGLQRRLLDANRDWADLPAVTAPDGDADLGTVDTTEFVVPPCEACGGALKPDVVFFGESVPRARVEAAYAALAESDLLLAAGTSLKVWSGYRFVRRAAETGVPIAIVNLGRTRADGLADVIVRERCSEALAHAVPE